MAAMTRCRAVVGNVPNPTAATYYAQRASAGLIVSEASQVSRQGVGYIRTPGIHSAEQVAGWRVVTEAVHRVGGRIFLQLWHVGRISHPDFQDGELPVAPSALAPGGELRTPGGSKRFVTPRALKISEIPGIVEQFRQGAENAKRAGFDGVELHGANGYVLDQFTRDGSNLRTDAYGGSTAKRARLPLELAEAVASVWGRERVGYKISPNGSMNSMTDSNPAATFTYLARELGPRVGYLKVSETIGRAGAVGAARRVTPELRRVFRGTMIVNGGYDRAAGQAAIESRESDLVAYGELFIANPDLPSRFGAMATLNAPDPSTYYAGEENGYLDYPSLDQARTAAA